MRRATSFPLLAAERLPGRVRAGGVRLLGACLAFWGLGMLSPEIDRDRAIVVLIVGWGVIAAGLLVLALGTQRVLHRLDVPLLGAGVARAAALVLALRRVGLVLLALAFFLFWTLIYIGVWRAHPEGAFRGLRGDADLLGLLLLLRLHRLHQPAGRHHRGQQGRAHGDHDRAAHRHGGAGRLPRLVPRLRRLGGRRGGGRRRGPRVPYRAGPLSSLASSTRTSTSPCWPSIATISVSSSTL